VTHVYANQLGSDPPPVWGIDDAEQTHHSHGRSALKRCVGGRGLSEDGRVAARLLAIANVLDGMRRAEAARAAWMDRQAHCHHLTFNSSNDGRVLVKAAKPHDAEIATTHPTYEPPRWN